MKPVQTRGKIYEDLIECITSENPIQVYHSIYPISSHFKEGVLAMWEYGNNLYPLPDNHPQPSHKRLKVIAPREASLEDSTPVQSPVLSPEQRSKKEYLEMLDYYIQWEPLKIL